MSNDPIPGRPALSDDLFAKRLTREDIETLPTDELHRQLAIEGRRMAQNSERSKVDALMAAGWTFELPENDPDAYPFQWRWRRPAKGKRPKGRMFASTGQAYNAMMRDRGERS